MSTPLRHRLEYAALRGLGAVFRFLPYRAALALAWGLAAFGHFVLRFRRREALRRIRLVLGAGLAPARARRIAWVSWRNLFFNAVELIRLPAADDRWFDRHVDVTELEALRPHADAGRPLVVATPHAGNWDLAGLAAHRRGLPFFFLARRQKNALTDAYLNRLRGLTGVRTVLNDEHVLRGVLRRLRAGGFLAILPDVRARTPALAVRFFGGEANLPAGMALFARRTGAPVYPVFLTRRGWTVHHARLFEPVAPDPSADREADVLRVTQAVADRFDRAVREQPEQYFWYNKRWVLDPPGPAPAPR